MKRATNSRGSGPKFARLFTPVHSTPAEYHGKISALIRSAYEVADERAFGGYTA
jgi:hypothetical protein